MSWYSQLILAQADEAPVSPSAPTRPAGDGSPVQTQTGEPGDALPPRQQQDPFGMFWMIGLFIILMWVMIFLPQRREKKRHAQLLGALKKGDLVQTIGGALGTVVEVRDREVILKVDEATNTRMRFTKSAIQAVIEEAKE